MFCHKLQITEDELVALVKLRSEDLNKFIIVFFDILQLFDKYDKKSKRKILNLQNAGAI